MFQFHNAPSPKQHTSERGAAPKLSPTLNDVCGVYLICEYPSEHKITVTQRDYETCGKAEVTSAHMGQQQRAGEEGRDSNRLKRNFFHKDRPCRPTTIYIF